MSELIPKPNIREHAYFEELAALSAIGQVAPAEYQELSEHLRGCPECQNACAEFSSLTHEQLPILSAEASDVANPHGILERIEDKRYKNRFASRAKEYGIEFSGPRSVSRGWLPSLERLHPSYRLASALVMAALLVAVGFLLHQLTGARQRELAVSAQVNDLSTQNVDLQKQIANLLAGKQDIEKNLVQTNASRSDLDARLAEVEHRLASATATIQALQSAANDSKDRSLQAQRELADAKLSLSTVSQQFAEFRAAHSNVEAASAAQLVQIADLSRRIKEKEEVIDKQQKLLSVDTDVRNLMAARSLHITDVFDIDGKGKKKSAFGRVFYTEGKSLVFYAFDLDGPKLPSGKHSFQAWAQLASSTNSAVSLGIFYVDDPSQKRWMLKFDNPDVLEQMSAVFVTAEPHGGAQRPTGQKLMYAYLGRDPNHP